jgi:hypothetical protein
VFREKIVEESPQHLVVEYKCPGCGRKDRMVGTLQSWEEFKREDEEETRSNDAFSERVEKAAEIELDGIDSVDDLVTLWRSYKRAPLREAVLGSCNCDDCKKRREL